MGFEPMNTGFADQRVSHFAIGAFGCCLSCQTIVPLSLNHPMSDPSHL
jgi:hypothetical protein